VTSSNWQNFDDHVQKVEDEMWKKENLIDELLADIPSVIIYGTCDGDDSDDELTDDEIEE